MDNNTVKSDASLARHAARRASDEATLTWMLSWAGVSVVSFPLRWELGLDRVSIPQAIVASLLLSCIIGAFWYRRAKRDIEGARSLQNQRRMELNAQMQKAHLDKLKAASKA